MLNQRQTTLHETIIPHRNTTIFHTIPLGKEEYKIQANLPNYHTDVNSRHCQYAVYLHRH